MWKASLYVAKSDTVTTESSTMNDFYKVGENPLYLSPVDSWGGWTCGARPSDLSEVKFSTSSKVTVLQELATNGGDPNALTPVNFVNQDTIQYMYVPEIDGNRLPPIPGVNDGYYYGSGEQQQGLVGDFNEVNTFFTSNTLIYNVLSTYTSLQGTTPETYVSSLELTIDGETKTGWDSNLVLPIQDGAGVQGNHVQWLLVYEPVSIIYVGSVGYAVTATDVSLMQIKQQMDWWYDETVFTDWAGQQQYSWADNSSRQNIARLAFLVLGNSILTDKTWFGLEASQNIPSGSSAIPQCRWNPLDQLKYGGWGMVRWSNNTSSVSHTTGEYAVTYTCSNGGTMSKAFYNTGDKIEEPTIVADDGYSFVGFYSDSAYTIPFDFDTYVVSGDVEIFAKFVKNDDVNITINFNSNGGSEVSSIATTSGSEIDAPVTPTKDNSVFTGWFKDSTLTEEFDFRESVTDSITLYAGWTIDKATVEYIVDGAVVATVTADGGSKLTSRTAPTKAGEIFVG
jgi:uncharacterized repeat protein (TIGR02543 family)